MPKEMEMRLKRLARKKGLKGKRKNAYIFGTMQRVTDWKPSREK